MIKRFFVLAVLVVLFGCGSKSMLKLVDAVDSAKHSSEWRYPDNEVWKFINNMLSACNEYGDDGKSVLTFREMQLRLELANKATEIYERIKR